MSHTTTILMFHGLFASGEEYRAMPPEDRPYAVDVALFTDLIDELQEQGVRFVGADYAVPATTRSVLLTFDDGHESGYLHAFEILRSRSISGIFFVTTDFIRNRSDYCNWDQLAEMAAAGMGIQSHGVTHGFLADMTAEQSREELIRSKCEIEDGVQKTVDSVSFPGGRFGKKDLDAAQWAGYSWCHTSQFGRANLIRTEQPAVLPRIALREDMSRAHALALARGAGWTYHSRRCISLGKSGLKKTLGNNNYHRLYRWWASR